MTASAKVELKIEVSGLGITTNLPIEFTHSGTPAEGKGPLSHLVGTSVADLDLIGIDPDDLLGVLIIARTKKTYIQVSKDGTGTPDTDDIVIDGASNEATYLNFASGLNASGSIRIIGDDVTSTIEYFLFGK